MTKLQGRWCLYCPSVIAKAVTLRPHPKPGTTLRRGQLVPPGRENWSRVPPWCPHGCLQTTARNHTHTSPTQNARPFRSTSPVLYRVYTENKAGAKQAYMYGHTGRAHAYCMHEPPAKKLIHTTNVSEGLPREARNLVGNAMVLDNHACSIPKPEISRFPREPFREIRLGGRGDRAGLGRPPALRRPPAPEREGAEQPPL